MKYKYILLDIDGTLVDFDLSFKAASRRILELDGTAATNDNIEAYYKINDDAWFSLDMETGTSSSIISHISLSGTEPPPDVGISSCSTSDI